MFLPEIAQSTLTKVFRYGSILSDGNNPLKEYNPTVVQVAASVVAAYQWIRENPKKGICWPDDLPHKYVSFKGIGGVIYFEFCKRYSIYRCHFWGMLYQSQ